MNRDPLIDPKPGDVVLNRVNIGHTVLDVQDGQVLWRYWLNDTDRTFLGWKHEPLRYWQIDNEGGVVLETAEAA